ncbi:LexA family transcriptional repressor [Aliarcobacter vitoriensis]|uniref:LexA family transcriptional repressor n=1 Tax=Aliarcobacter vitoriensis TaxID=2011099 RepID=A0A366MQE0_9BACT|nr:LexA family transcriptional repressor [Aliarcobacter vitoriensis]
MALNEILEKLKDILSKELDNKKVFDKDIAQALDINYDIFRKAKQYNRVPYWEIMQFLAKRSISINWFFFNQLPESLIENTSNYIILKYYNNVSGSAGLGTINYHLDQEPLIIDTQVLDYINSNYKYTELIKANGDSMYPLIHEDSLIFIDTSIKEINNKDIFVVNVDNELFIKQIIYKGEYYILKSINTYYKDIKTKELVVIGKVKGVLNKI